MYVNLICITLIFESYIKIKLSPYGICSHPYTRQSLNKLESIQRRAAHFVIHDYHQTSSVSNNYIFFASQKLTLNASDFRCCTKFILDASVPTYITYRTRHTRAVTLKSYSLMFTNTVSFLLQLVYESRDFI